MDFAYWIESWGFLKNKRNVKKLYLCISRGEKIPLFFAVCESVSWFFKHITCIYILQYGKTAPFWHAEGHAGSVSFRLYNLDEFYRVKMSIANQSSQSPVAADRVFRGVLLCVWIRVSLLTKELTFLSDFCHRHLKRSCDYPEGGSPVVTHYNA